MFLTLSLYNYLFAVIFFSILIKAITAYKQKSLSLFKSAEGILHFLDLFFIKNKLYTYLKLIVYFFLYVLLFIFLRYNLILAESTDSFIKSKIPLLMLKDVIYIVIVMFFIIVNIMLYKRLIDLIFFDEFLKFFIYIKRNKIFLLIRHYYHEIYFPKFFGKYYLFCTAVLNSLEDIDIDSIAQEDVSLLEYADSIYTNTFSYKKLLYCINISAHFYFFRSIFIFFKFSMKILYRHFHLNGFLYYVYYLIFFILFFKSIIINQVSYIFYLLIINYIINILYKGMEFIKQSDPLFDLILYNYFYKNDYNYSIQRVYFFNKDLSFISNFEKSSLQNEILCNNLKKEDFVSYIKGGFKIKESAEQILIMKRYKDFYLKNFLIAINFYLMLYIIFKNNIIFLYYKNISIPLYYLLLLVCLMCFVSFHSFKLPKDAPEKIFYYYQYNKYYSLLYWGLFVAQFWVIWLLLIKPNFFLLQEDLLFSMWGVELYKNWTLSEKIEFLYQYLEYYLVNYNLENYYSSLHCFIKENNIELFLKDHTRVNEIKNIVYELVDDYTLCIEKKTQVYLQVIEKNQKIKSIMDPFINIINILTFWKFFIAYLDAYYLLNNPINPRMAKLIFTLIKIFNKYK